MPQTTLNLNLAARPAAVTKLEAVIARLRKVSFVNAPPNLVAEIAQSIRELEEVRGGLSKLLCCGFEVRASSVGEGKPEDFNAVKFYAEKIGLPEQEAERFWNFYSSKGWRVGHHVMKSWHHALVNWRMTWEERRASRVAGNGNGQYASGPNLQEREMRQLEQIARKNI